MTQCPVCEAELASVALSTELGSAKIGPKCARMLEQLALLMGLTPKRGPMLRALK